ncbi:MAG: triose-phosphate isomerase [Acidobacteria bacterium]|nr:triose-phosphate isomerase [Acidobacteriota bacterium]
MNVPPEGIEAWCHALTSLRFDDREIFVAPPFPFLSQIVDNLGTSGIATAGQTCSWTEHGALTGEVSPGMIRATGAKAVLVGHSERRASFGENDSIVARKLVAAASGGLTPILCIGETADERSEQKTAAVLERQLESVIPSIDSRGTRLVVAYEPVWAIGTGENATPDQVAEAHELIARLLGSLGWTDVPILYGGSVKPSNAGELAAVDQVSGFLVGGASLSSQSFIEIIRST